MLSKLQIRTRLLVSYAIIVALMVITGGFALNRISYVASRTTELYDHPFTVRKSVRDATLNFLRMHSKLKDAVSPAIWRWSRSAFSARRATSTR